MSALRGVMWPARNCATAGALGGARSFLRALAVR